MRTNKEIISAATRTLRIEAESVAHLVGFLNAQFAECVKMIYASKGRVVITGIGKSAIIANKIVATLNSTGTPAIFMHAGDAIHGDLGIIQKNDVVIVVSKSGSTPEIKVLVPLLKQSSNKLVAIVGNTDSYLAKQSDFILNSTVEKEACPNNLAPTSSTTAQLAMGDALAVCLLEMRNFSSEDFARFHPGGTLGKKLYLRVSDIYVKNEVPKVKITDNLKTVILEMSSKRLGATAVLDGDKLAGVITDGDLRRMMEKSETLKGITAKDIMTKKPKTVSADTMATDALQVMQSFKITQLLVTRNKKYLGIVHLHDFIKEGIL